MYSRVAKWPCQRQIGPKAAAATVRLPEKHWALQLLYTPIIYACVDILYDNVFGRVEAVPELIFNGIERLTSDWTSELARVSAPLSFYVASRPAKFCPSFSFLMVFFTNASFFFFFMYVCTVNFSFFFFFFLTKSWWWTTTR